MLYKYSSLWSVNFRVSRLRSPVQTARSANNSSSLYPKRNPFATAFSFLGLKFAAFHTEQVERKGNKEDITPEQTEKLEKVLSCPRKNNKTYPGNEPLHAREVPCLYQDKKHIQ